MEGVAEDDRPARRSGLAAQKIGIRTKFVSRASERMERPRRAIGLSEAGR